MLGYGVVGTIVVIVLVVWLVRGFWAIGFYARVVS
jgi:hypothetical protein